MKTMPPVSSHDRILVSAKRLFARNGYENTSTIAIAREAGTSESQLMKHFGSKEGLLSAIFERGWESIADRVRSAEPNGSAAHRLVSVLEALAVELESDAELKDLLTLESRRVRKDSRDLLMTQGFQQFAGLLEEILGQMQRGGQLRPDVNLHAVRAAVMGMTEGLIHAQVVARRSGLRSEYGFDELKSVLEMLVAGLGNNGAQPLKVARG